MIASQAIPAVWVYTTGDYAASRGTGLGAFLTAGQKARLERIRQARMLFDGQHKKYFLDESRTQFEFAAVKVGDRVLQMYLTYNVLGLISLKSADLLFGESPLIDAEDEQQQTAIDDLAERCNLHALLYGAAVDASYEGECFLEACVTEGEVYLTKLPADEIFPVGDLRPDGQYAAYVRYSLADVGVEHSPIWLLLTTTYTAGRITRVLQQIDRDGRVIVANVDLAKWPGEGGLMPETATGISQNTITWIPNLLLRGQVVSDYDGAIDLQDALNAKNSQVGRVLMKHADPKMVFPEEFFDAAGNAQAGDASSFREPDRIPKYITWDAQLESAMADRAFVLNQLLVRTETSPVLLGLKEGAAPDAYKKVRLESFNSLTKAARKAAYWRAGIRRAVTVAQDLELTLPGYRYDRGSVAVTLRDGIPQDDKELAEKLSLLRAAGLVSRPQAISELYHDPAHEAKELADLDAEHAAAMPASLQFEPAVPAADPCRPRRKGEPVVPELSPAGLPQRQLDVLVGLYTDASARMKDIVLNPKGRTQGSREFRQARAAQQIAQIETITRELGRGVQTWTAGYLPVAYTDGQKRAVAQAKEAGVRVAGSAVQGGFAQIDRDAVNVFAQAITHDLAKADGSLAANATKAIRTTAQNAIGEADLNKLLAGGLIDGTPVETTRALAAQLKAVVGEEIEIPTKTGGTMTFKVRDYADLVVVTQTRKANEAGRHNKLRRLNLDLVAVIGALSGNFCTAFLGQVFSLDGKSSKYPALAELPGGGPPFHPRCSKSTRPYLDSLATETQKENAEGLDDAKKLLGLDAQQAQKAFKDLQLKAQVKGGYAKAAEAKKREG